MRRHSKGSRAGRSQSPSRHDMFSPVQAFVSETNPSRPMRPSPLAASTIRGMPLDLVDRIRQFPFFSSAPDAFLVAIGSHLRLQVYSPQENIMTEGDDAKAMYWLVRGAVMVTSRDRESIYAELQPGSFFGEIGIMMDIPRTASIVARYKSMVMRLNKEDLQKELPKFPEVERAIRDEAAERLAILERKKRGQKFEPGPGDGPQTHWNRKRSRDLLENEINITDGTTNEEQPALEASSNKRRKSPSPALVEVAASSALSSGAINVRQLLRELPLFANLPDDILHFLGLNAQPRSFAPFTKIIQQGSTGRDVYFITDGEVEVYTTDPRGSVKARLKSGSYFGEVTSLSLAPKRTATVRSVTSIECLIISGDVLDELWRRCPPNLRRQVEKTARERLSNNQDTTGDVIMSEGSSTPTIDMDDLALEDVDPMAKVERKPPSPQLNGADNQNRGWQPGKLEPFDPDPFPTVERVPRRVAAGRRGSLPNTPTDASPLADGESHAKVASVKFHTTESGRNTPSRRPEPISRQGSEYGKGRLPNSLLIKVFQNLSLADLFRLRRASLHWSKLISTSPLLFHNLDLSQHNRRITDTVLAEVICPVVGQRPRMLNLNNCFHISDEGFNALANQCVANLKVLKMKSVWDISPQAVVEMANKARNLEEIDFSNCRKVSDNLLSRVIGWVVRRSQGGTQPPEGTVVGCPSLSRLTLSYCKHVSDRFMAHLAFHASERLEQMDLTRCTTITDMGFRQWGESSFPRLRKLILADCTYLTDHAIIALVRTAKALEDLDLVRVQPPCSSAALTSQSFCCALSDTAVEALASGCPSLRSLNLAFCGSAVSDSSMQSIALSLRDLRFLSVRGCVRVTGAGVEGVLAGCPRLKQFDVSQCRNLKPWLDAGGVRRSEGRVRFCVVAEPKRWVGVGVGVGGIQVGERMAVEVEG